MRSPSAPTPEMVKSHQDFTCPLSTLVPGVAGKGRAYSHFHLERGSTIPVVSMFNEKEDGKGVHSCG